MFCPQNIKPNFFPTRKSSHWSWGDLKGPHDPTRATSMKTSLKNRLFYDSVSQVALFLKRREFWLELKRGTRPSSDRDCRQVYRLAVPVLK